MRAADQLRRMRRNNLGDSRQVRLRPGLQARVERVRHLPCDDVLRGPQRRPVIVGQPQRHLDLEHIQQLDEVVGPAGRDRARAHGVLEREVPADDPGEQLAQRGVGVCVGAAGQRDHGRELRVAESREGASQSRHHEREHEPRAGIVRAQPGEHEDARADDGAHAEGRQLERSQGPPQAVRAGFLSLFEQQAQRLPGKQWIPQFRLLGVGRRGATSSIPCVEMSLDAARMSACATKLLTPSHPGATNNRPALPTAR